MRVLKFLLLCTMVMFLPALALAQSAAPAPAAGIVATIEAFVVAHLTFSLLIAAIPIVGGFFYGHLSAQRRDQIADGVDVAFYAVENLKQQLAKAGKSMPAVDKVDAFLGELDKYMAANGWRELSDKEKQLAQQKAQALHAQDKIQAAAAVSPDAAAAALAAVK